MKLAIVSFTRQGMKLAERLVAYCKKEVDEVESVTTKEPESASFSRKLKEPLASWVKKQFKGADVLIFIGACGIAVRSIAPFLETKTSDPAVLVVDELGKNMISLLSGHLGGANEWTIKLSEAIGANPVITTASDVNEKPAIDVFAKKNNCIITDMTMAKKIESAILEHEPIGFFCEGEVKGSLPCDFYADRSDTLYSVTVGFQRSGLPGVNAELLLIPKAVNVGIGCKKGKTKEDIETAVKEAAAKAGLPMESLVRAATIDLKKNEAGLRDFCKGRQLELLCFSAEQLKDAVGDFSSSGFVKEITGVDNVCERAAVLAAGGGRLLLEKQSLNGVTVAFAAEKWSVQFE